MLEYLAGDHGAAGPLAAAQGRTARLYEHIRAEA